MSATAVAAAPQWWVNLLGMCSDSDNGPTDPDQPLPFIGINGYAQDPDGKQFDECLDENGKPAPTGTHIRERSCGDDKKVKSNEYDCTKHGFIGCVDVPGKGAACVRKLKTTCGDNVVQPPEQCDPAGVACVTPAGVPGACNPACRCVPVPPPKNCGNKRIDAGEQCDPPNTPCKDAAGNPGMCNQVCKCPAIPPPKKCGDKVVHAPEQCDPPGSKCKNAQGKESTCNAKCGCPTTPPKPRCGDQKRDSGEECDPPGQKCMNAAGLESTCSSSCTCPVTRVPTWCGNNRVDSWEDCDPPGTPCKKGDLLSVCNDYCKCFGDVIRTPSCGDKILDKPYEQCETDKDCPTGNLCKRCKCIPPAIETEMIPLELTSGIRTTPQPTTPPPTPKSCDELCKERGMTTTPQDWSQHILEAIQRDPCSSSHRISSSKTTLQGTGVSCTCYSSNPPTVTSSGERGVCQNTPCGPVQCGQSTSCSCGENCIVTVGCGPAQWGYQNGQLVQTHRPEARVQQQSAQPLTTSTNTMSQALTKG